MLFSASFLFEFLFSLLSLLRYIWFICYEIVYIKNIIFGCFIEIPLWIVCFVFDVWYISRSMCLKLSFNSVLGCFAPHMGYWTWPHFLEPTFSKSALKLSFNSVLGCLLRIWNIELGLIFWSLCFQTLLNVFLTYLMRGMDIGFIMRLSFQLYALCSVLEYGYH